VSNSAGAPLFHSALSEGGDQRPNPKTYDGDTEARRNAESGSSKSETHHGDVRGGEKMNLVIWGSVDQVIGWLRDLERSRSLKAIYRLQNLYPAEGIGLVLDNLSCIMTRKEQLWIGRRYWIAGWKLA
jgi:hypothetical protein